MAYTVLLFITFLAVKAAIFGAVFLFTPAIALIIIPAAYLIATKIEPHR